MSNSDNEMEDYIKNVKTKMTLGSSKKKNSKSKFTLNSLVTLNPYVLYITSFLLILVILLIIKPKCVKKGGKLNLSKLFLTSIIIYIPVFFLIFLFYETKNEKK